MTSAILVTGATGFVGSAVAGLCQRDGFAVRSTARSPSPVEPLSGYEPADLTDDATLARLLAGVEAVVHSAGLAHQFGSNRDDIAAFRAVNTELVERMVRTSARAGVRHFVLISSVSVYGSGSPARTETSPCHPVGAYAQSKYEGEQRAIEAAESAGMALTFLRLATVYGEGDRGNVNRLMVAIDRGRFVRVGTGTNRKSLIHRDDVARAVVAVLRRPASGTAIYNVSAPTCTMREVTDGLALALGRRLPRWSVPGSLALGMTWLPGLVVPWFRRIRATLVKWLADDVYDASRFAEVFGFQTEVTLADGLRRQVARYRGERA